MYVDELNQPGPKAHTVRAFKFYSYFFMNLDHSFNTMVGFLLLNGKLKFLLATVSFCLGNFVRGKVFLKSGLTGLSHVLVL